MSDAGPQLNALVAGFVILMVGLAVLAPKRHVGGPLIPARGSRRALLYVLVFGLCATSFWRVIGGAILGTEHSPWLLALGDVMFVTLGLFAWVMFIAEDQSFSIYGLGSGPPMRMALALFMGLGPVALVALTPYQNLLTGATTYSTDRLVFAFLLATVGSALPEELLFRGYLMGSMDTRTSRWARVALPALAFTAIRSTRFLPGVDLPLDDWLFHVFGLVLPLGLWWGLMRDWSGGSIWPSVVSHFLVTFGPTLAGASPADF